MPAKIKRCRAGGTSDTAATFSFSTPMDKRGVSASSACSLPDVSRMRMGKAGAGTGGSGDAGSAGAGSGEGTTVAVAPSVDGVGGGERDGAARPVL